MQLKFVSLGFFAAVLLASANAELVNLSHNTITADNIGSNILNDAELSDILNALSLDILRKRGLNRPEMTANSVLRRGVKANEDPEEFTKENPAEIIVEATNEDDNDAKVDEAEEEKSAEQETGEVSGETLERRHQYDNEESGVELDNEPEDKKEDELDAITRRSIVDGEESGTEFENESEDQKENEIDAITRRSLGMI